MQSCRFFCILALSLQTISQVSYAQDVLSPADLSPVLPNKNTVARFFKLIPAEQQLTLRGLRGRLSVPFPVSNRVIVHNATIHIDYTSSILLLDETSQISLIVNDIVLSKVPLLHLKPDGQFDANVPDNLLKSGYNDIEVEVAQHYAPTCEDPAAPELWTRVNAAKSYVSYLPELIPVSPNLSDLDQTLDKSLPGTVRVNLVTGSTPTDQQLLQGAIIAEGIALRRSYSAWEVTQSAEPVLGVDNILVGIAAQLVAQSAISTDSSFLQIQPDASHLNLIVGGTTDRHVIQAAMALSKANYPLPESPEVAISSDIIPDSPLILEAGSQHHLSDLGFKTSTEKGTQAGAFQLEFDMASDCFARVGEEVELNLHFAYGEGIRRDSVANILVNGQLASSVPLDGESGGLFQNYRIQLAIGAFEPGHNIITVQPQMLPVVTDYCSPINQDKLFMVLHDDSTITVPAGRYKMAPDLRLFSRFGIPLFRTGVRGGFTVYLAKTDSNTVGAAWTLLAKLAQKAHRLVLPSAISGQLGHPSKPILAIGATDDLSDDLLEGAPFRLGQNGAMGGDRSHFGQVKGNIPAGEAALLTSYYSPFDPKSIVILYTAGTPELLQSGLRELIQPQYWENLKGNTATWEETPESLTTNPY